MAAVSNMATTFNLPNYVGELFHITPTQTQFLSMIGGLTGGVSGSTIDVPWQTDDNNAAAQPSILEGADPTYEERDRTQVDNTKQIFQYGVEVSYTKQAATSQIEPIVGQSSTGTPLGSQPVNSEIDHQVMLKLKRAARDVDYSLLNGTYARPTDNLTARKTRGLVTAITTNAVAAGSAAFTKSMLDEVLLEMYNSGAPFENVVLFCGGRQKQRISDVYGYAPDSRNVGGLNIQQIETDFATLGVSLERQLPTDTILLAELNVVAPAFLPIPGKGHFFLEEKPASGASRKFMLYGEVGLIYGPELWHGKITGLATS